MVVFVNVSPSTRPTTRLLSLTLVHSQFRRFIFRMFFKSSYPVRKIPYPTLLALDIIEINILYKRRKIPRAVFPGFVSKINQQYGFAALADIDIADIYILDNTAAAVIGLYPDNPVQRRAVHLTILHEKIPVTSRNLAPYNHTSMAVLHMAVTHDYVFTGDVPFTAVIVAARLDRYTIVAGIEETTFDKNVFA